MDSNIDKANVPEEEEDTTKPSNLLQDESKETPLVETQEKIENIQNEVKSLKLVETG